MEQMRIYTEQAKAKKRQRNKDLQHARAADTQKRKDFIARREAQELNNARRNRMAEERHLRQMEMQKKAIASKAAVLKGRADQVQEKINLRTKELAEEKEFADLCVAGKEE